MDMRKINKFGAILFLALTVFVQASCAGDGKTKLHVKTDIVNWGDTIVALIGQQEQTFTGKQGKFEFDVALAEVSEMILVAPALLRGDYTNPRFFRLPAVPGEEVVLTVKDADASRYDVEGTGFYAEYHKVDLLAEEAGKELRAVVDQFQAMRAANTDSETLNKFYNDNYVPQLTKFQQWNMEYIKSHPAEESSATLLNSLGSLEQVREAVAALAPEVREGRMKPLCQATITRFEEQQRQAAQEEAAALKQAAGLEAPDFTLNDINGKPLSLSSFRGKYVVLDFWGSWCIWCIKGFPQMKEYYNKYKGKFEILGIDCNDRETKWKDAVKKHELPWLHVYNPEGSTVLADYAIQGFPTKIIVGPDGKIVKTIVGEDPSFYTLLDELFGK